MAEQLLEFEKVTKIFRRAGLGLVKEKTIKALDEVSLTLPEEPQIVALVGESGSGKTTMARIILGLEEPTSGQILYKGIDVAHWLKKDRKRYKQEVQIIFQDPYGTYNPFYRVDRVFWSVIKKFKLASTDDEAHHLIEDSLEAVGLRHQELLGRYPHQLSGGERQRFMLARIYMLRPNLIVADEPVSMLDASLRAMFLNHLKEFKKLGMSCLYVTHDLNIAYFIADRIVILCTGQVVEQGATESIIRKPLHPYTQDLISSIPTPDPNKRWEEQLVAEKIGLHKLREAGTEGGCIFYNRCSHVMDKCQHNTPPLEKTNAQEVACFLYPPADGK
ncbi:MAG: ABC transporter ATP-binding protein [Candidatus Bipolaricaulia bacterium]